MPVTSPCRAGGSSPRTRTPRRPRCARPTEEVGLDAAAAGVRVIGALETFWIPVSDYRVTPIVAIADRSPCPRALPGRGRGDLPGAARGIPRRGADRARRDRGPRLPAPIRRLSGRTASGSGARRPGSLASSGRSSGRPGRPQAGLRPAVPRDRRRAAAIDGPPIAAAATSMPAGRATTVSAAETAAASASSAAARNVPDTAIALSPARGRALDWLAEGRDRG